MSKVKNIADKAKSLISKVKKGPGGSQFGPYSKTDSVFRRYKNYAEDKSIGAGINVSRPGKKFKRGAVAAGTAGVGVVGYGIGKKKKGKKVKESKLNEILDAIRLEEAKK